jgi:hypothetical protein
MKLVTFSAGGGPRVGVVVDGRVHDMGGVLPSWMLEIGEQWDEYGPLLHREALVKG